MSPSICSAEHLIHDLGGKFPGYEVPVGWVHFLAVGGFIPFRWWHLVHVEPESIVGYVAVAVLAMV